MESHWHGQFFVDPGKVEVWRGNLVLSFPLDKEMPKKRMLHSLNKYIFHLLLSSEQIGGTCI